MRIGLLACDYGDGTTGIRFYRTVEAAEHALDVDEEVFCNEDVTEIDVPDDFVPPGFWADDDDDV